MSSMPFTDLKAQYAALKPVIDARIQRVLDHGQYILGPEVRELEEKLAAYTGSRHCVTVASGTEALLIALMALDIKPGDEVTIILCPAKNGEPVAYIGSGDPGTKVIFSDGRELDFKDRTAP